ncbi:MAG TPA: hypothetical protein VF160_16700 [Candidatus Dormibacteraeota bacterium]
MGEGDLAFGERSARIRQVDELPRDRDADGGRRVRQPAVRAQPGFGAAVAVGGEAPLAVEDRQPARRLGRQLVLQALQLDELFAADVNQRLRRQSPNSILHVLQRRA